MSLRAKVMVHPAPDAWVSSGLILLASLQRKGREAQRAVRMAVRRVTLGSQEAASLKKLAGFGQRSV